MSREANARPPDPSAADAERTPVRAVEAERTPVRAIEADPSLATLLWTPSAEELQGRPGYRVGRRIGAGGFAEVYEAELRRPPLPPERVALKRLLPALRRDPVRQRQLRREAQIGSQLRHDHIARVLELLDLGDELAIAMELVEGVQCNHLLHRIAQQGLRLRRSAAGFILSGLFEALRYLEAPDGGSRPLVHADLSLENLMLTQQGVLKLIDFGVAAEDHTTVPPGLGPQAGPSRSQPHPLADRLADEALTSLHQVAGKRTYVPPEGAPRAPTVQSDLYAAGVCAWEILAGCRFPLLPKGVGGPEMGSLIAFAADGQPAAAWILLKSCLAIDPEARMRSASVGLELVQQLQGGTPAQQLQAGLGALVGALMKAQRAQAEGAATPSLGPLPPAAELLLEPRDFIAELVRRIQSAFCAHRVLALRPDAADPSAVLGGAGYRALPFLLRAEYGEAGPLPRESLLRAALDTGYLRGDDGTLCFRVRPPGDTAHVVCVQPGPGHRYEPLAEMLLRNLLVPTAR
ncbi:MAG: protein kinase [Polyangia bacterium]